MLTVVIPTLNAAQTLPGVIAALGRRADQIIVVDGGSSDSTPAIARRAGLSVLTAPRGRGAQLAAGVAAADGPWLLLLHADTRLGIGWPEAVTAHIQGGEAQAGYFSLRLDSADLRARRLEHAVAWRCRRLALPYGDQGLLIHRDLLAAVGGIRPLPLMEDVDLVRRLDRDRLVLLGAEAITSAAKWEREGWTCRSARNLVCLGLWFAGVPPRLIARAYG